MSEEIGKHKGAVETLLHEKKELSRILKIVNSQLQRHLKSLEEAGIDTEEFINDLQQEGQKKQQKQANNRKQDKQRGGQSSRNQKNEGDEEFDLSGHLE